MARRKRKSTDVILKEFWRQNDRFADLFNAVVFSGKNVIHPETLQEMDTDLSGRIQFSKYEETVVRIRDVVKKTAYGVEFVVLGIESQKKVHYAMPLRTLLYDGLGYLKEYQEIVHTRKQDHEKMTDDEFLSGMRKEDRLHPIISIVVYYSEKMWDGPLCLKDMIVEMPEEIEQIFSDYKMNLLQVRDSDQYCFHNEDVKTVFDISREIFRGNFDGIAENYNRDIDAELAAVIGKITDNAELIRRADEEEVVNMCTSLENLKQQGINEGIEQGIEQGIEKGIKQGIEQGIEKGIEQGIKLSIEKMLKLDYPVEEISRIFEVPEQKVLDIQKEIN
jgi:hypothetical protein